MTRIFTTLASIHVLALAASIVLGFASHFQNALQDPSNSLFLVHLLLGLFTTLGILLIHCIIFTYFLGTGRWVKEVKLAYRLPDEPLPRLTRDLKRRTFPPALAAMLITIATAAAGTGTQLQEWPWQIHASLALVALAVNIWAFRIEYCSVRINAVALEDVLREVDRIRALRGLPSNAEALRQDA
jgi:hypothetical protein